MEDLEKLLTWNVASNWLDEIDNFSFQFILKQKQVIILKMRSTRFTTE